MSNKLEVFFTHSLKILIGGIEGAGMRAIAEYCCDFGHQIFGYDDCEPHSSDESPSLYYHPFSYDDLPLVDILIVSTALDDQHQLLQRARQLGITVVQRPDFLVFLSQYYKVIGITGTYGKTTCSALLQHFLTSLGVEHDFIIGGQLRSIARSAKAHCQKQRAPFLLIELDESRPFSSLWAFEILCILNIAPDHLEFFADGWSEYQKNIISLIPKSKICILPESLKHYSKSVPCIFYSDNPLMLAKPLPFAASSLGVARSLQAVLSIIKRLIGPIDKTQIESILGSFEGISYRFEIIFQDRTRCLLRDYGHLPEEIRNLKTTLSSLPQYQKHLIVFQPHKYSRTAYYFDKFIDILQEYHHIILLPVYACAEHPSRGYTHHDLASQLERKGSSVNCVDNISSLNKFLEAYFKKYHEQGVVCVFQGAGSIKDYALLNTAQLIEQMQCEVL